MKPIFRTRIGVLGSLLFLILFSSFTSTKAPRIQNKVRFDFSAEPIDVVIPSTDKDIETLELCIDGIRNHGVNIRRVIVISDRPLTDKAEWFDENQFPFGKLDVALWLLKGDPERVEEFDNPYSRAGWYFQQLLKLYAPYVIPDISSNVLLLDSDTIFLNRVKFQHQRCGGLYNIGEEYSPYYFEHAERLLPGFKKHFKKHSGITHHMLVQKPVLDLLFSEVESVHHQPFWQAFCKVVDIHKIFFSGASEYEIYFNYVFSKTRQVRVRPLKWANVLSYNKLDEYQSRGYHFVTCHSWSRDAQKKPD